MSESESQDQMRPIPVSIGNQDWETVYTGLRDLADRIEKEGDPELQYLVQINRDLADNIEQQYISQQ